MATGSKDNQSKVIVVFFLAMTSMCYAFLYEAVFEEEEIFTSCKDYPNNFIPKFVRFPENMSHLPNDTIYVQGTAEVLYDFKPDKHMEAFVEFLKKGRGGNWEKTLFSLRRFDLCTSLFDKTELWYTSAQKIPQEQRTCPFYKGQLFTVEFVSEQTFDLPTNSMAGDYIAHFEMGSKKNLDDFACVEVFFNLYRV